MTVDKFINWCDKAMVGTFFALIYFLPISIALAEIFTGTAFFFFLLKRGGMFTKLLKNMDQGQSRDLSVFRKFCLAFKPYPNNLNTPILILLVISLISVVKSQYLLLSIEGFVGKVLQSVFLYLNFVECMRTKKRLKIFMTVFFISCTLICINGLYQSVFGHGFIHGHIVNERVPSSFRAANDFGAYLIAVIPILFSLVFLTNVRKQDGSGESGEFVFFSQLKTRVACLILFLFGFICLGFTYSRGAWIGFILSLILMSLFGMRSRKTVIYHSLLVVLFLIIFYPSISIIKKIEIPLLKTQIPSENVTETPSAAVAPPRSDLIAEPVVPVKLTVYGPQVSPMIQIEALKIQKKKTGDRFHMGSVYRFLSQNNRLGYWKRSLKIIKDYPFFGSGLNTYALIEWRYNVGWGGYPHNSYLQMTAETGLMGLCAFLWMQIVLFWSSLKTLRKIKMQEHKMLFFGVLTGLLGFMIHSFFDTNFYSVQLGSLMWIIMGLVVALQNVEQAPTGTNDIL